MHEFSIAEAIAGQVRRHERPGARIRDVEIVVGALRGLEPEALQMSWQAVTFETPLAGCTLTIEQRPWTIACGSCGRSWTSPVPFVTCECGNETPDPHGTDELDLVALTIEEAEPGDEPVDGPSLETGAAAPGGGHGGAAAGDGGPAESPPVAD